MALRHIKTQSILSLMIFTLTENPEFYGLEVSLGNMLMLFSKKKIISQQKRKEKYIYDVHKNGTGGF